MNLSPGRVRVVTGAYLSDVIYSAGEPIAYRPRLRTSFRRDIALVLSAAAAAAGAVAILAHLCAGPPALQVASTVPGRSTTSDAGATATARAALGRMAFATAERAAYPFSLSAPLRSGFQRVETALRPAIATTPPGDPAAATASAAAPEPIAPALAMLGPPMPDARPADLTMPLPVPRPDDLIARLTTIARRAAPGPDVAAPAPIAPKAPGLFERLFGSNEPSGPALAYANPQDGLGVPKTLVPITPISPDRTTAIYDISARTVTLPDGTKLEAHSGLRELLDDPSQVHVKMKGATPPAVYDLTLREKLFHGVEALRLTPVAGSVFGRVGLLAHSYMLGPNGDSNGCVSFRNYDAFLAAFKRGLITRLAVVARAS